MTLKQKIKLIRKLSNAKNIDNFGAMNRSGIYAVNDDVTRILKVTLSNEIKEGGTSLITVPLLGSVEQMLAYGKNLTLSSDGECYINGEGAFSASKGRVVFSVEGDPQKITGFAEDLDYSQYYAEEFFIENKEGKEELLSRIIDNTNLTFEDVKIFESIPTTKVEVDFYYKASGEFIIVVRGEFTYASINGGNDV